MTDADDNNNTNRNYLQNENVTVRQYCSSVALRWTETHETEYLAIHHTPFAVTPPRDYGEPRDQRRRAAACLIHAPLIKSREKSINHRVVLKINILRPCRAATTQADDESRFMTISCIISPAIRGGTSTGGGAEW